MSGLLELANRIVEFFTNSKRSFSKKAISFLIVSILILSFDSFFKISYNIHVNNKLSQLEKINSIRSNSNLAPEHQIEIQSLENKIISSKHYSDYVKELFTRKDAPTRKQESVIQTNDNISTSEDNQSPFWVTLSSSPLTIILLIVMFFFPLFNKSENSFNLMIGWIVVLIALTGYITLKVSMIINLVPTLLGDIRYNYWIYLVIHLMFWIVIGIANYRKTNKSTN